MNTKAAAESQEKAPTGPVIAQQPETPAKAAGPQHATQPATPPAAPQPNDATSIMRSAEMVTNHEGAGAASRARTMMTLQRRIGNNRISNLVGAIQTKLTVGAVDDPHEHEADQVAEALPQKPGSKPASPVLRQFVMKHSLAPASTAQRQTKEEEKPEPDEKADAGPIQRKEEPHTDQSHVDNDMEHRIASPAGGKPLPEGVRAEMESGLGADFSQVRVHDNAEDQADARRLNAKAFTHGEHIWLGAGESAADRKLMAHELTHVVQQGGSEVRRQPLDDEQTETPTSDEAEPQIEPESASAPEPAVEPDLAPTRPEPNLQSTIGPPDSSAAPNVPPEQPPESGDLQTPPLAEAPEAASPARETPEVESSASEAPEAASLVSETPEVESSASEAPATDLPSSETPANTQLPPVQNQSLAVAAAPPPAATTGLIQRDANDDDDGILAGIRRRIRSIADGLRSGWESLSRMATEALQTIRDQVNGLIDGLIGVITSAVATLQNAFAGIKNRITQLVNGVKRLIESALGPVVGVVRSIGDAVTKLDGNALRTAWNRLTSLLSAANARAQQAMRAVFGAMGNLWDGLRSRFTSLVTSLTTSANALMTRVQTMVQGIRQRLSSAWDGLRNRAGQISGVLGGVLERLRSLLSRLLSWAESIWNTIRQQWSALSERVGGWVQQLGARVRSAWQSLRQRATNFWNSLQNLWARFRQWASRQVQRFVGGFQSIWNRIRNFSIASLIDKFTQFGRFVRSVQQAVDDPDSVMTPFVDAIAAQLEGGMPAKAMSIGHERLNQTGRGNREPAPATAAIAVQRQPADTSTPTTTEEPASESHTTATWAEVGDGFVRHITAKWAQLNVWQLIKDMLWSIIWPWPAVGDELSGMWDDLKAMGRSLFSPRSPFDNFLDFLHDLWSNLLHLLDIPLILGRRILNIAMLLMGWVTIALVIIGAIGGTFAGTVIGGILGFLASAGIATGVGGGAGAAAGGFTGAGAGFGAALAIGEGLFILFLAVQGATLVKTLVTVLTARQTQDEKERDYSLLADTLIGLGVAAVLFALGWIASRLASFIMDALAKIPRLRGPIEQFRAGLQSTRGRPPENTQSNPKNTTYGTDSDTHVRTHGHAADGQPPAVDAGATKKAGHPVYKSKFAPGEGGQAFTNEVMNHPNAKVTVQGNGRTLYEVHDLGRVTGTGRSLEPVSGGSVVVEGPTPHPKSKTAANHVVTQFPSGKAGTLSPPRPVPVLPPVVPDEAEEE